MLNYNPDKQYYEMTAYVYNLRSKMAVAVVKGSEEKVQSWIDKEYPFLFDTEKTGTCFDLEWLKGINKHAIKINIGE